MRLSPKFREATRIVAALNASLTPQQPPPEGRVLIRRVYAGVNASDINFTSG